MSEVVGWHWRNGVAAVLFVILIAVGAFLPWMLMSAAFEMGLNPPDWLAWSGPVWVLGWLLYLGRS